MRKRKVLTELKAHKVKMWRLPHTTRAYCHSVECRAFRWYMSPPSNKLLTEKWSETGCLNCLKRRPREDTRRVRPRHESDGW